VIPRFRNAQVAFHGGEPFLAPVSKMREVWRECKDLWPNLSWTATTNLVYNLDQEKIDFMSECLDKTIATSWDKGIRFAHPRQEELWEKNVKTLTKEHGFNVTMTVSLSRDVIQCEPIELIRKAADVGAAHLHLERITPNGNARLNPGIFPTNQELDAWFMRMYEQTIEHKVWEWGPQNMFLNSILSSLVYTTHSGCRCRACEQKIFTLNADGTIGGCPNGAPESQFGTLDDNMYKLITSPGRMKNIQCEINRNSACYTCPVFDVCNGDCNQLPWQGNICPAPKTLMTHLRDQMRMDEYKNVLGVFVGAE
jgi:radical SAM protein with 4Fe4S-binding SPASM domain